MALQGKRRISAGIVQDPSINNGRPIIEGTILGQRMVSTYRLY